MSHRDEEQDVGLPKPPGTPTRVLTGVKPTGVPHIGNYLGAIQPAVALAKTAETFLFIADLHALTTERDPKKLQEETYSVAATWLACGVDPKHTVFYKQSDIAEVTQLAWILSCVTPLGFLNRAHSFKDAMQNRGLTLEEVSHGLFSYPVLMAADILMFDADVVPVGKDQKQHLEITQEIARKLNHNYGPVLRVPRPQIDDKVMTIPGLDGRKMSKSYDNTIELFSTDKELTKKVKSITTNSTEYGHPLEPKSDTIFLLYSLFASPEKVKVLEAQYRSGRQNPEVLDESLSDPASNYFGWGQAKRALAEQLLDSLGPARREYARLIADRAYLRGLLLEGAQKARSVAERTLARVEEAVGVVR